MDRERYIGGREKGVEFNKRCFTQSFSLTLCGCTVSLSPSPTALPSSPPLPSLSLPSSTCTPCFCIQRLSLHLPRLRPRACKKCIKGNSVLLLLQLARVFPVLTFFFYFFVSHCCCCFCFLLLLFSLHFFCCCCCGL